MPKYPRSYECAYMNIDIYHVGFPSGTLVKNPPANAGDSGSILGSGRFPGRGNGNPLQYSCLGNPWTGNPGGLQSMESKKRWT